MHEWQCWVRSVFGSEQKRSLVVTVILILTFFPFLGLFEEHLSRAVALPSAWISSLFIGADCIRTPEGYMLTNDSLPVHVTRLCSATGFLSLLLAMMIGASMRLCRFRELARLAWIIPMAYIITIAANSTRIAGSWVTGQMARRFLHEDLWAAVHMGTGITVFVTFLCATYFTLAWSSYGQWRRTQTVSV